MCARSEKQVCVQVHITRAGRYPNRLSTHSSELLLLIPLEKQASLPANLLAPVLFVIPMRAAGRIVLLGMGHHKAGVLGSHRRGDRQAQQDDAEQAHVCVRLVKTAECL